MRRLPPLTALPAFEAAARLGSVTAAAGALGRTHSAISKQIAHLSEDLGGSLFEKAGTGLKLTPRGERLRVAVTAVLDQLDGVSRGLRGEVDGNHITLLLSATLATRWLTPRLPRLYRTHPEIEIRLLMAGPSRVPDHEFDLMLSYDRLRTPAVEPGVTPIGDTSYGPVCSPDYPFRAQDGIWTAPVSLTHMEAAGSWQEWARRAGVTFQAGQDLEHPHHMLVIEAAAAGLGVALSERRLVERDLATGRLAAPLGFVPVPGGFHAKITAKAAPRKAVRNLLGWLSAELERDFP